MVDITDDTKRVEITIAGITFDVPEPYVEGHILTATEAAVLNQTYKENLRNNFAATVKKAVTDQGEDVDLNALGTAFAEYVEGYEFGVRKAGSPRIVDPVAREAMKIAKQKVRDALKAKGFKLSGEGSVPGSQITELAESVLASEKGDAIKALAQQTVDAQSEISLGDLDLTAPAEPTADAPVVEADEADAEAA